MLWLEFIPASVAIKCWTCCAGVQSHLHEDSDQWINMSRQLGHNKTFEHQGPAVTAFCGSGDKG